MRVYIAGPLGRESEWESNIKTACAAGAEIFKLGGDPFVPHLFVYLHREIERTYEDWLSLDLRWLETCDVCFRIPGKSPGADREVQFCRKNAIPVIYRSEDLIDHLLSELE